MSEELPEGCALVKVQIPISSSPGKEEAALVYNEDKSLLFTCDITPGIREAMRGRPKAFFYAAFNADYMEFNLTAEAPWQEW